VIGQSLAECSAAKTDDPSGLDALAERVGAILYTTVSGSRLDDRDLAERAEPAYHVRFDPFRTSHATLIAPNPPLSRPLM
jgi:hypothetical protein